MIRDNKDSSYKATAKPYKATPQSLAEKDVSNNIIQMFTQTSIIHTPTHDIIHSGMSNTQRYDVIQYQYVSVYPWS